MEKEYLVGLNESQLAAVENITGPSLIIAGAGSGKTKVLTSRVAHLLDKDVAPSSVLVLTFTNKASREMRERISNTVGAELGQQLWMGTFHSIFSRILRSEADLLGYESSFTIYDTQDSKSLIKQIIKKRNLDTKDYKVNTVLSRISLAKNNLWQADAYLENDLLRKQDTRLGIPMLALIYSDYARMCKEASAMDFDDLLLLTNVLFLKFPDTLKKYQEKFKYILVDEYQDTNFSQNNIISMLSAKHHNIAVVGDDAQSIYSFRGAKIENILSFEKEFEGCQVFKLERNYRSTKVIVEAANSVIAHNKTQLKKRTYSENIEGDRIKILKATSDVEEGGFVVKEILERFKEGGYCWDDFTILYRTNAQSRIFEEALRNRNIPYRIYGGLSFYQRKEVKDLLSYFKLIVNSRDNSSFKRAIGFPKRGIGKTTIDKLEQAAEFNGLPMIDIASDPNHCLLAKIPASTYVKIDSFIQLIDKFSGRVNMWDAAEFATELVEQSGFLKAYLDSEAYEDKSKAENIQELLKGIKDFATNSIEQGFSFRITDYLNEVSLLTDQDLDDSQEKDRITLMTVHSSKGLEFKNVFIVGLEEGLFPSCRENESMKEKDVEEERRLFYVALTRAEQRAWFSFAKLRFRNGKRTTSNPSRFIEEVDKQYLQMPNERNIEHYMKRHEVTQKKISESQKGLRLDGRLRSMDDTALDNFRASDPSVFKVGDRVEHQTFGQGSIREILDRGANMKVVVLFDVMGERKLFTRYAKLKILKD